MTSDVSVRLESLTQRQIDICIHMHEQMDYLMWKAYEEHVGRPRY